MRRRGTEHFPARGKNGNPYSRHFQYSGPVSTVDADLLRRLRVKVETRVFESQLGEKLVMPERRLFNQELGHIATDELPELPVRAKKEELREAVARNPIVIFMSDTGTGKSTQIPQYAMEWGFKVTQTEPTILTTELLEDRIGKELVTAIKDDIPSEYVRDLVGHHTALSKSSIPELTQIELVTEGLEVARSLGRLEYREQDQYWMLILDEAHIGSINQELILASLYQSLRDKPEIFDRFRVVILSATMDPKPIQDYFRKVLKQDIPIIEAYGRTFPIHKKEEPESTVFDETMKQVRLRRSGISFVDSVGEVNKFSRLAEAYLEEKQVPAEVYRLHSKIGPIRRREIESLPEGSRALFTTNVADTGVTIPHTNYVIDSGTELTIRVDENGIEGLVRIQCSREVLRQRMGRTGREKIGNYILTRLTTQDSFVPFDSELREDRSPPEIDTKNLTHTALRMSYAGLDVLTTKLLHPQPKERLIAALNTLKALGAVNEAGRITHRGERMAQLPLRPELSRMVIEAEDRLFDEEQRIQVAAMVTAVEAKGMQLWQKGASTQWTTLTNEGESDLLAQLDIFASAENMTIHELAQHGIDISHFERAEKQFGSLLRRMNLPDDAVISKPSPEQRHEIKKAITAGLLGNIYWADRTIRYAGGVRKSSFEAVNNPLDKDKRILSHRSIIQNNPKMVVGFPIFVEKKVKGQRTTEQVIQFATVVDPDMIHDVAPDLSVKSERKLQLRSGKLKSARQEMVLGKFPTSVFEIKDAEFDKVSCQAIVENMLQNSGPNLSRLKDLKKYLEQTQHLTLNQFKKVTQADIEQLIIDAIDPEQLDTKFTDHRLGLLMQQRGINYEKYVSPELDMQIRSNAPPLLMFEGSEYEVKYKSGIPQISMRSIEQILALKHAPFLPDGRQVRIRLGKKARPHPLSLWKSLHKKGKLQTRSVAVTTQSAV